MQTPFPINTYDITKVPSSIVAKFRRTNDSTKYKLPIITFLS